MKISRTEMIKFILENDSDYSLLILAGRNYETIKAIYNRVKRNFEGR